MLPIGTDAPQKTRPTVNYVIIGLNVACYLLLDVIEPHRATSAPT